MATLSEKDITGANLGKGIIMPIMQHRWRFRYNWNGDSNSEYNLTSQIVRCSIDLKNKVIALEAEENVNGDVVDVLRELVTASLFKCNIDALGGDEGIYFSNEFHGAKIADHIVEYDYAKNGLVVHKCKISFSEMIVTVPEKS